MSSSEFIQFIVKRLSITDELFDCRRGVEFLKDDRAYSIRYRQPDVFTVPMSSLQDADSVEGMLGG